MNIACGMCVCVGCHFYRIDCFRMHQDSIDEEKGDILVMDKIGFGGDKD